ncbi:MAG: c-type cytochrome [Gemmatimonadota bacterium]|jgi:mono/diheme cytochrome c family protein
MRMLVLVTFAAVLAACGGPSENPSQSTAADTTAAGTASAQPQVHQAVALTSVQKQGQVVFESVCWTCHGSAGHGDGPATSADIVPPTFQTQDYALASEATLEARFGASLNAGADPQHPHMQYVAKLVKPTAFKSALTFIPALAYPPEIPGSAIHGQEIFQYRCAGCHGADGRGDGPAAANLVGMKPANFTTDTLVASADWDAVYDKIRKGGDKVHGSLMPAWGVVLKDADVWDLVAYLATFQPGLLSQPVWER